MAHQETWAAELPPDTILDRLIDSHGTWATLRALARVLAARRRTRLAIGDLGDHLRRDIGLPERAEPPPPLRDLWF